MDLYRRRLWIRENVNKQESITTGEDDRIACFYYHCIDVSCFCCYFSLFFFHWVAFHVFFFIVVLSRGWRASHIFAFFFTASWFSLCFLFYHCSVPKNCRSVLCFDFSRSCSIISLFIAGVSWLTLSTQLSSFT